MVVKQTGKQCRLHKKFTGIFPCINEMCNVHSHVDFESTVTVTLYMYRGNSGPFSYIETEQIWRDFSWIG